MNKKFIIFGASSFVAEKIVNKLIKNNNVITFSSKNVNFKGRKLQSFKTNYNEDSILKILKRNLKNDDKPIFIFFNAIPDKSAFLKIKKHEILKILKVNLIIPMLITNMIVKNFLHLKSNFIFMSSSRAHLGDKGIATYSTTKRGLAAFSENMSIEYGSFGQNFRVILLGLIDGGLKDKIHKDKIVKKLLSRSSIDKYVTIKEIIKTINYILSDKTGNGSIINCDNGYH